jgi:hypothetical protein
MVRRVAKRATFVYLSIGMRVHNLHDSNQQDERNAKQPDPTGPGRLDPGWLRLLSGVKSTHLKLDYSA